MIIAVGTTVAGAKLGELGLQNLCVVYHPGAIRSKEDKMKRLRILRKKAVELGLGDVIPGALTP